MSHYDVEKNKLEVLGHLKNAISDLVFLLRIFSRTFPNHSFDVKNSYENLYNSIEHIDKIMNELRILVDDKGTKH